MLQNIKSATKLLFKMSPTSLKLHMLSLDIAFSVSYLHLFKAECKKLMLSLLPLIIKPCNAEKFRAKITWNSHFITIQL